MAFYSSYRWSGCRSWKPSTLANLLVGAGLHTEQLVFQKVRDDGRRPPNLTPSQSLLLINSIRSSKRRVDP